VELGRALIAFALGVAVVDLDTETAELLDAQVPPRRRHDVTLPLLVAADRRDPLVIAVVARRPPLVISRDCGRTWREAGGGLGTGRDVAISPRDPEVIVFAGQERLYLSTDGGRFWRVLAPELPEITRIAWTD
jgi:hypothetical protein